jgi:hypothetical protein
VHVGCEGFDCQYASLVTKFANGYVSWLSILKEKSYSVRKCRLPPQYALYGLLLGLKTCHTTIKLICFFQERKLTEFENEVLRKHSVIRQVTVDNFT